MEIKRHISLAKWKVLMLQISPINIKKVKTTSKTRPVIKTNVCVYVFMKHGWSSLENKFNMSDDNLISDLTLMVIGFEKLSK
jgi:hypothetical protein